MRDDDIRRYLDGEVGLDELPEPVRAEARSWDRLLDAFRVEAPGGEAPPWLEQRVMAEIDSLPQAGPVSRALEWLLRPRPVRVSPLTAGLALAAVAALTIVPRGRGPGAGTVPDPGAAAAVVYVQFTLEAPGARTVSVGGDFDGWAGSTPLEDPDGDGVWTGRVAVEPGVYTYMFRVDGSEWVTDPRATRYTDDGFGNRNAVLAVAAPAT